MKADDLGEMSGDDRDGIDHRVPGQLGLPAWLGRRAPNLAQFITEFDRGLYREGGATLYVSCGLGFTGQKIRLFTPREIACIALEPA